MRFLFINIIVITLIQCNHKPGNSKAREYEIEQRELTYKIKEPLRDQIPDSMKQWMAVFDTVRRRDQRFRSFADPSLYTRHLPEQELLNSMNQTIVTGFIKTYGYPSKKQI